jgi:hypothetical protein
VSIWNAGTDVAHDVRLHPGMILMGRNNLPCDEHQERAGCPGADELPAGVPLIYMVASGARTDEKRQISVTWREGPEPEVVGVLTESAANAAVGRPPGRSGGPR